MSTYTRPTKTVSGDGTTSLVAGNTLPASELNAEFDGLTNKINGDLDEDNLSGSTQIPNSYLVDIDCAKVVDHADDAATYNTATSPGDSGTPSLPTDLEEELERIRYRIGALKGYRDSVQFTNSSDANADAAWYEPLIRGRNLLKNPGFEGPLADATSAPDGWTEVGTITGAAIEAAAHVSEGDAKRSFVFDASAADEGVSQTVQGLKASTKYLFGFSYELNAGSVSLTTQGALAASNNYQDPAITDSSTGGGVEVMQAIVQTDSTPTDITVGITSGTTSTNVNIINAWFYELGDDIPAEAPSIPTQTATHNSNELLPSTFTSNQWNWEEVTELALSQYIPGPGYRLIFECDLVYRSESSGFSTASHGIRLKMDTNVVDGPRFTYNASPGVSAPFFSHHGSLRYVVDHPTPGATYDFTVEVGAYNDSTRTTDVQMRVSPTQDGEASVSRSWLRVERI